MMMQRALSRRAIALFATYVVVLQALLLPLSVSALGAAIDPSLCKAAASQLPQPASHDSGCPCAAGCGMQCCTAALSAPPSDFAIASIRSEVRVALPEMDAFDARPYLRSSQLARAPPAA